MTSGTQVGRERRHSWPVPSAPPSLADVTSVHLVTFPLLPDGEPRGDLLVTALAERDIDARWVSWDDPTVDWAAADAVALRATWDYHRRCSEFFAWVRSVERRTRLLNGADAFAWNADKAYLTEIADRLPVVPSSLVEDRGLADGLAEALGRWGTIVVKARTGAGGVGVVLAESTDDLRLAGLTAGPWLVQPLVASVRTVGETSVFVMGGRAVSQVDKLPGGDEIRVHEQFGGSSRPVPLDDTAAALAEKALAEAGTLLGQELDYGRVDLMEYDGQLVIGELELIEPGLYLDVAPENADRFADLVADLLR
jgi:glutathione synthase/RimK-type ligase-like ATP-grasp enzyme